MTHLNDELLDAAADDEPPDAAAAEHVRTCAECRASVERLKALRAQLAALPKAIATEVDVWPKVRETIRARRMRRRVTFASIALPLAAAITFAVVNAPSPPEAAPANELAELRGVVPPLVVDAMAANLTIYDAALRELESHAAVERENPDLPQRIADLRRKRAALLRLASNS